MFNLLNFMYMIAFLNLDISQKSAEIVVLVAFGVPLLKEITRHQLLAVINKYMERGDERKGLQSATKTAMLRPLAKVMLQKKLLLFQREQV